MKELWEYLKGFFIISGLLWFSIFVLAILVAMIGGIFGSSSPEWSGSVIDDLLYYAYNSEKFGSLAFIWRLFIVYAVLIQSWTLLKFTWEKIKTKLPLKTTATPGIPQKQDSST